jgi:hypothetical protein
MDPRIAWYPNELIGTAYQTWSAIWMFSQMTSTHLTPGTLANAFHSTPNLHPLTATTTTTSHTNQLHSPVDHLVPILSSPALANLKQDLSSATLATTAAPDSAYTAIINGLKNRKLNKASSFGFNFPINQYMLDDPMSTPWTVQTIVVPQPPPQTATTASQPIQKKLISVSSITTSGLTPSSECLLSTSTSSASSPSCSSSSSTASSSANHPNSNNNQNNEDYFQSNLSNITNLEDDEYVSAPSPTESISSSSLSSLDFNSNYQSEGMICLHKEILMFAEYIAPTPEELFMRDEIIWRITKVIQDQFPFAQVDIFGSYKTGASLKLNLLLRFAKYETRRIVSEEKNSFTTVFSVWQNLEKPSWFSKKNFWVGFFFTFWEF